MRFLSELTGWYRGGAGIMSLSLTSSGSFNIFKSGPTLLLQNPNSSNAVALGDGGAISINAAGTNQNVGVNPSGTGGFTIGSTSAIRGVRSATASVNFVSIAAGAGDSRTVTVTGAAVGDAVFVCPSDGVIQPDELQISAVVTAADTVTLRAVNRSAGVYDAPAKSYRVTVLSF